MKAEDLFMAIHEIDEDMVEDAWTENDTVVILSESRPFSFWKTATAVAACFAAVISGIFCFTKLKPGDVTSPDSSASFAASSQLSENSSFHSIIDSPVLTDNQILFDDTHTDKNFYAEKTNYDGFATLNIEETNATHANPVYLVIYSGDSLSDENALSNAVCITGPGKYGVYYNRMYDTDSVYRVTIDSIPDNFKLVLKGTWKP